MVTTVRSLGITGISGYEVAVECFLSGGLPAFDVVGLPDTAVKESRERVRAAAKSSGFDFPMRRITINLAPANTRKEGSLYDLPILLGVLAASGEIGEIPSDAAFLGELSLEGGLNPVTGVLSMAIAASKLGIKRLFLPSKNAAEAAVSGDIEIYPADHIREIVAHLSGKAAINPCKGSDLAEHEPYELDFSEVQGQHNARRALEIAASGEHNILLIGPPGTGKSMLAKRLPTILPPLSREEALETIQVHSVAGLTYGEANLSAVRPFRSPHHTISHIGMAGGGAALRPGELSLSHRGVLFLDELPEFSRETLEVMRQPLEDGVVTISRVAGSVTYPCSFMLVCAMNPCRCGWYGHPSGKCTCSEQSVRQYLTRISGPLLDRIDLHVEVPSLKYSEISSKGENESSKTIRERVIKAREIQKARMKKYSGCDDGGLPLLNAHLSPRQLQEFCVLSDDADKLLQSAFDRLHLTARSHTRILRVARTIADMAGSETIEKIHVAEAIQYRSLDREK